MAAELHRPACLYRSVKPEPRAGSRADQCTELHHGKGGGVTFESQGGRPAKDDGGGTGEGGTGGEDAGGRRADARAGGDPEEVGRQAYPISTVGRPITMLPPCAVMSPIR